MKNEIKVIVNNKAYSEIKEIEVVKDLDYLSGSFDCVMANRFIARSPVEIEDQIEIQIGSNPILLGNVDRISANITNSLHDYILSGSDWTSDIETTEISVNATYQFKKLKRLCEKVLSDNDINYIDVIDNSSPDFVEENGVFVRSENDFPNNDEQSGDTGQTIFDFLSGYAEKAGRVLTSDGEGRMIIYSNSGINEGVVLDNTSSGVNKYIKTASITKDFSNRYKKVIVVSQALDLENNGQDIRGEAEDKFIRRQVNKVIINESVADADTAKKIAQFEVNKRRSDSIQYNCTVAGFYAENGKLWAPNLLVSIIDENLGIKATMLLKRVRYKFNENDGSTCDLSFVSSDAFSLRTEGSQLNEGLE